MEKFWRKMASVIIVLALILENILTSSAYAANYTFTGKKLRIENGVVVNGGLNFIPYQGFGSTTVTHFNHACYPWNEASGFSLVSRSATTTHSKTAYPKKDGMNAIYAVSDEDDYVAKCTWYYSGNYVIEADINLNMKYQWANSAQSGRYDVWSVFMHEVGHAVGMGHSSSTSAVMYSVAKKNYTRRSLHTYDRQGIAALY